MKAASVCTILGLTLISGALLAATAGGTGETIAQVKSRFDRIDADENRRISPLEAMVSAGLSERFDKLDANGDGALSWPEFRRHRAPGGSHS